MRNGKSPFPCCPRGHSRLHLIINSTDTPGVFLTYQALCRVLGVQRHREVTESWFLCSQSSQQGNRCSPGGRGESQAHSGVLKVAWGTCRARRGRSVV